MKKSLLQFFLLIIFISTQQMAFAQEKDKTAETAHEKAAKKIKDSDVIEMEALKIEGKIQKPEVQYIMTRGNLSYKWLSNKKSFIKDIVISVKKNPF